jgi:hypothetical protein
VPILRIKRAKLTTFHSINKLTLFYTEDEAAAIFRTTKERRDERKEVASTWTCVKYVFVSVLRNYNAAY